RGDEGRDAPALIAAVVPYAIVLGGMLVATTAFRLAPGAPELLAAVLGSPAWWLGCAIAYIFLTAEVPRWEVVATALRMWGRVAPPTALFMGLGVLMSTAGLSHAIAVGLASLGIGYLAVLPFLAACSGFIAGSNTGANALAAASQAEVARALALDVSLAMGAHNAAASASVMVAPARIELAAQLARVPGERNRVMATMLATVGASCVGIAALSFALLALGVL
ncbi:L-lactate permease, partial [Leucobacter albus]